MDSDVVAGDRDNLPLEEEGNENSGGKNSKLKIEKDSAPKSKTYTQSAIKRRNKRTEKKNGEDETAGNTTQDDKQKPDTESAINRRNKRKEKKNRENETAGNTTQDDKQKHNKPSPADKEKATSLRSICNSTIVLLVVAFLLIIVAISIPNRRPTCGPVDPDFDFRKIFETKLQEFQSSFTNQTDRFWRILKNRGLSHLRNANPTQPLVLLLAAPPAAHSVVDCLARKLAEVLDPKHKRELAAIDGKEKKSVPGEKAKKNMDDFLIERFKAGHRAALVHHLELLPPPSPLLFYSYCDDQNAPHKHVAIIFTVHLPTEPDASLSPSEAEGTVEKYLAHGVWAKEDQDAVAALLSRVADTVALMNGDPAGSATC